MPIELFWGNSEQTVLYAQFGETWTLEEFHTLIDEMYEMISAARHTVHIINDFSRSRSSPNRLLSLGPHIERRKAINTGIHIIIGATAFLKSMIHAAQRMYLTDSRIYLVNSVDEAYQIIQEYRAITR